MAMKCHLGALGIIVELTIQCEEKYHLECFETMMPLSEVLEKYKEFA